MNNQYEKITKKNTKTFYYSTIFFPNNIKNKVFLLYSFVRTIDNLVDSKKPKTKNFYFIKKEFFSSLKAKKKSKLKVVNDFLALVKEKKLEKEILDYLRTQEKELKVKKYKKIKDFNDFTYGVAGTIGIMMAKILDLPKKSYQSAKKLGQSLQIINNVRDIFEDFQRGKIYIPEELLNKYQLNHKNFLDIKNREKLYQVIKELLLKAKNLQEQAKKDFKLFNKKKLLPIKIACDLYNLIAKKIAKNPELIFSGKKLKPNFFEIISLIVKNFLFIYVFNKKN